MSATRTREFYTVDAMIEHARKHAGPVKMLNGRTVDFCGLAVEYNAKGQIVSVTCDPADGSLKFMRRSQVISEKLFRATF